MILTLTTFNFLSVVFSYFFFTFAPKSLLWWQREKTLKPLRLLPLG
jgi:hypothetical protein